ncbi:MAG: PAS domain S-box protein [Syntrophaceae bacterium]|nr:PAS domain S-box protein [Syntrophaceae bacterium]
MLNEKMKKKSDEAQINKTGTEDRVSLRRQSDKIQHERAEKYRNFLKNVNDGCFEIDLAGNFTFFNDSLCRVLGYPREELMGINYRQYSDEENAKRIFEECNKVYNRGEPSEGFRWQVRRKDGSVRYIETSISLQKDSDGKPTGFIGVVNDITERKQIEDSLRLSEGKYRSILDNIQDSYFEVDLSGNFTFFNDSLCRETGCSRRELTGANYRQFSDKENSDKVFQTFNKIYKTEVPNEGFDWLIIRKDGSKRYVEASASLRKDLSDKPIGFRGIIRDITERKQTEALLKQRETQYRLLADHMKDQVWTMTLDLKVNYISPSVEKLLGYTLNDLIQLPLDKLFTPASFKAAMDFFNEEMPKALAAPPTYVLTRTVQLEFICKDGKTVWGECNFSFIRDENGKPLSVLGEGRNITERKQAEEALKKSEERYRSIFENAGPMIIMKDSLEIFMVNDRFMEMLGYEKNEIEGKMKFTDFIVSEDHDALMEKFSRCRKDKPVEHECRIAHHNGEQFDVLIRIGHIPLAGQFIASFTDITSRKQAEVALLESREHLQRENIRLRSSIRERYRFCDIIGKSQVMQEVYEFILQAAATQANVIIYGESGTGKELVAKAIHDTSDRSKKTFVTVNCGAIPETLMESEFFGYKKGAFTGAATDKRGYLDEADGGTLFLDEVGEIGLNMQVKLLRAIAGGGYAPVGSSITKNADVRIIAATNRNLWELVKQGIMREDFFYRIHILPINLPPLRERKDDLPLLVDHFLNLYDENHAPLPMHVLEALLNYNWPGNIRQLQNVLHRYLTLKKLDFTGVPETKPARGLLKDRRVSAIKDFTMDDFPNGQVQPFQYNTPMKEANMTLDTLEKDRIMKALSENKWHRQRTATALGIDRKTLFRKMQKFGLTHH